MVDSGAAATHVKAKGQTNVQELTRSQRAVARRSAEARATVPDLELSTEIDMAACTMLRRQRRSSVTAMLVRACSLALRACPLANGAYRDEHFELYSRINVGVAIATDDTYMVATVFDADSRSLAELTEEIDRLGRRARCGELTAPELSGATFTLANLGMHDVSRASMILNPHQAAAVAAGAIREVPVLRGGAIVPGEMMTLTLASDHRILYGATAAGFLAAIGGRLAKATL